MSFDAILQRLQNMTPFNIYQVNPDGTVAPWYNVNGSAVVSDLLLTDHNIREQVQTITGRIADWGRLAAQAKRVWSISERNYRVWRSTMYITIKNSEGKKTEKEIEATYRIHPDYARVYNEVERAEEAYNATLAILDAWKAKLQVIKAHVYRQNTEDGAVLTI